jgi:hypothetical protein
MWERGQDKRERNVQYNRDDLLRVDSRSFAPDGTYIKPDERRECPEAEECGPHHEDKEKL